jgi:hypothetical protein
MPFILGEYAMPSAWQGAGPKYFSEFNDGLEFKGKTYEELIALKAEIETSREYRESQLLELRKSRGLENIIDYISYDAKFDEEMKKLQILARDPYIDSLNIQAALENYRRRNKKFKLT